MGLLTAIPFFIAFFIFGQNMVQLFMSGDASALASDTGITFLRIVAPFYFVISIKLVIDGMLRGAGCDGFLYDCHLYRFDFESDLIVHNVSIPGRYRHMDVLADRLVHCHRIVRNFLLARQMGR